MGLYAKMHVIKQECYCMESFIVLWKSTQFLDFATMPINREDTSYLWNAASNHIFVVHFITFAK